MLHKTSRAVAAAGLSLLALSCGKTTHSPLGAARVRVDAANTLVADNITRVSVTLSATDLPVLTVDLAKTGTNWSGLLSGIKAGSARNFHASAFDTAGKLLFAGDSAPASIAAGETSVVVIVLQQVMPPPDLFGSAPAIDSVVLSGNDVAPGAPVSATVTAHDPDPAQNPTLTYAWSSNLGSFSPATQAATTWSAPTSVTTAVTAALKITVTNGEGLSTSETISVTVEPQQASGGAQIDVGFNHWPVISAMTPQPSNLAPGRPVVITAAATDPDGDPLTYAWTSVDCDGTFDNLQAASVHFTVAPAITSGTCTVHLDVSDGRGGLDRGDLELAVQPDGSVEVAPQFDYRYQSLLSITSAATVLFKVTAHSPAQAPLVFRWAATRGQLGAQADTAGGSSNSLLLTPSCTPNEKATVTVTVDDGRGSTATAQFNIDESCPP